MTVTFSAPAEAPKKKNRSGMLPLLILLFLVSYSILTLLVVEQGRTIESQRALLREMLKDSTQLAELKGKLAKQTGATAQSPAQTEQEQKEPAAGKTPATKDTGKESKRSSKSTRSFKSIPQKPAADLEDVRRSTRVI